MFGLIPYVAASIFQRIYEAEQYREIKTGLIAAAGVYIASGTFAHWYIPGFRFGLIFSIFDTKVAQNAYWEVIEDWWKVFHFYHDFKGTKAEVKDLQNFE